MMKLERQKLELTKDKERVVLKVQESAKAMKDKLNRMGIERIHRGPRISDPAHTRDTAYSFTSSSVMRGVKC